MPKGSPPNRHVAVDGDVSGSDECGQEEVIAFLADPSSYSGVDRVDLFETHGNLVFLAGVRGLEDQARRAFPLHGFFNAGQAARRMRARSGDQPPIRVRSLSWLRPHCALVDRHTCLRIRRSYRRMGRPHAPVRPVGAAQQYGAGNRNIERPGAPAGGRGLRSPSRGRTRISVCRSDVDARARKEDCRSALPIRGLRRRRDLARKPFGTPPRPMCRRAK